VGWTPWSARVPLDPLSRWVIKLIAAPAGPTGASAADQGVRPTTSLLLLLLFRRLLRLRGAAFRLATGHGSTSLLWDYSNPTSIIGRHYVLAGGGLERHTQVYNLCVMSLAALINFQSARSLEHLVKPRYVPRDVLREHRKVLETWEASLIPAPPSTLPPEVPPRKARKAQNRS
jgi:hypothetical protein